MFKLRTIFKVALINFRRWRKNPQVIFVFCLTFILCFLLSDKVVSFAQSHETSVQLMEPFIWTFGDSDAIWTISLLILLLFSDMPRLENDVPFYLIRMNRRVWILGQIVYVFLSTGIFMLFVVISTIFFAAGQSYVANLWSDTAAILGYSGIGQAIEVPAFVKVLEMSFPYSCSMHVLGLMLGYTLFMAALVLYLNLYSKKAGMLGGMIFACFGKVLTSEFISKLLGLPQERMRLANIVIGWISPLNHATYVMHNFGYDSLPRLWMSYAFFIAGCILLIGLSVRKMKTYAFSFSGTKR